jgi:hypothetical protein
VANRPSSFLKIIGIDLLDDVRLFWGTQQSRWSWGCVSAIDIKGRTIWITDAHRDDGKRFVVRADQKLTAFLELERVTRESFRFSRRENVVWREFQI